MESRLMAGFLVLTSGWLAQQPVSHDLGSGGPWKSVWVSTSEFQCNPDAGAVKKMYLRKYILSSCGIDINDFSVNTNVSVCVYVYMRMKMSLNGFKLFRIINSKWFQQSTFSYLSSLIGSPFHILIILRINLFSIKSMTILIWTFA